MDSYQETNAFWDEDDEEIGNGFAVHPGLVLKNSVLPSREMTAVALAEAIGAARPGLSKMLNGRRDLTAEMALKIGAALDYPADALMMMMTNHDLARARAKKDLVDRIAEIAAATYEHLEATRSNAANENYKVRNAM